MDFGDLILILLLLLPVLSRLFGKNQPQPQGPAPAEEPGVSSSAHDPLGEALRQIREALGEPHPESKPSTPAAPPKPLPERPKPVTSPPVRERDFHGLGEFGHDEHGFGLSSPLSEEAFEQRGRPVKTGGGTKSIPQRPLKKVDLATPLEVKGAAEPAPSDWARRLRDPERAREAFVLKEVLGPPRSLQPRR